MNQLGFAAGQVPSSNYLRLGQSRLIFRGLIPVVFHILSLRMLAMYLDSKIFKSRRPYAMSSHFLF